MPNPYPPLIPYDEGDAGPARQIVVQSPTLHRTIGTWPGDYSVGKHRSHNDGTFQFLIGQDPNQWVQFYPANTFCSHGAGANEVGFGIELSGQNGEPLTNWQIHALGHILRWGRDEWGVDPTFTAGDPRVYADQLGPLGFITHDHIYYPGRPDLTHHDYITEDEFNRALGVTPTPPPEEEMKPTLLRPVANGKTWVYDPVNHTKTWVRTSEALNALIYIYGVQVDGNPGWANVIADARDTDTFTGGGPGNGGGPLTVQLTGTANPV